MLTAAADWGSRRSRDILLVKEYCMPVSADALENRETMILKMIRKSNAAILNFVKGIKLRSSAATILGGFAGLSLTANVIPSAVELTGVMDSFSARWGIGGYAVYSVVLWAVGGWAAQRTGSKGLGAITLGSVGLTSGLLFTAAGIGTEINTLLAGGGASLLYGGIGGMIIGDALRNPPPTDIPDTSGNELASRKSGHAAAKRDDSFRLFRYFR